jgi:SM-20-related protein
MIDLDAIAKVPLDAEPFPHMAASGVLSADSLAEIGRDFPAIASPGLFPLSELQYSGAFARLIDEINSDELAAVVGEKFGIDLSGLPLMITVRAICRQKDGRIHTDTKDKVVTCLLYLNDLSWSPEGGRLRLLRSGTDLNSTIAEIPPNGGNFIAFKRTENSWHGHEPFVGPRRYVMFNWMTSDAALSRNVGRHKFTALLKKIGVHSGY